MIEPVGVAAATMLADLHARAIEPSWSAVDIAELLTNPATFAFLSPAQGFVLAWAPTDEAELLTLVVVPEARRRGVGAGLVGAVLGAGAARGASALHLEVAADNESAINLYAKLGFAEIGRRQGYYQREAGAVDAMLMRVAVPITTL